MIVFGLIFLYIPSPTYICIEHFIICFCFVISKHYFWWKKSTKSILLLLWFDVTNLLALWNTVATEKNKPQTKSIVAIVVLVATAATTVANFGIYKIVLVSNRVVFIISRKKTHALVRYTNQFCNKSDEIRILRKKISFISHTFILWEK